MDRLAEDGQIDLPDRVRMRLVVAQQRAPGSALATRRDVAEAACKALEISPFVVEVRDGAVVDDAEPTREALQEFPAREQTV